VIEHVRVAGDQPSQSSRVFLGMTLSKRDDARVRSRRALLQELLRHWLQAGGGDEGLMNALHARGDATVPFLGRRGMCCF